MDASREQRGSLLYPVVGQPQEPGTPMGRGKDDLCHTRLRACLAVTGGYFLLVGLAVAVRWEAHHFGFMLLKHEREAMVGVLIFHWGGVLIIGALYWASILIGPGRPWRAKFALAAMPLLLIASLDRLATVSYRPVRESAGLYMAHPTRGWTLRPGWTGKQGATEIRVNSRGLRDPEVALKKRPGERRVLFLGDSVTYGYGVPEDVCFVARFRQRCGATVAANRRLTAINLAVPAYSTWQEYDLLVHEGFQYEPDVIVLVFCLNDVLAKFRLVQFGGLARGYEPTLPSAFEWSGLYRMARARRARRERRWNETFWNPDHATSVRRLLRDPDAPLVQKGWKIIKDSLERITAAARQESIPLVIVCAPYHDQVDPAGSTAKPSPQDTLGALARRANVPFLDLLPLFRRRVAATGVEASTLFVDLFHFSPDGHELAAREMCAFLADHGFLD